jgi:hypothetical protein
MRMRVGHQEDEEWVIRRVRKMCRMSEGWRSVG